MNRAKAAIGAMSSSIGIEFRPFSDQLKESVLPEKPMATLSGAFGFLAALLATLGLYGVIAYTVARRRNEIREAILLLGIGLLAGVVLAWWAGPRPRPSCSGYRRTMRSRWLPPPRY
jgi:hypothetical protein